MKFVYSFSMVFVMTLLSINACGQSKTSTNTAQLALGGYDVVAYHTAYEAVRGSNAHTATFDGATYYFSNADHLAAFKKNPAGYLPQYGGHCAFAMAMKGAKVPADPRTFKTRDGKLYLFFNDYYEGKPFNTIVPWNGKEAELVNKADANWRKL